MSIHHLIETKLNNQDANDAMSLLPNECPIEFLSKCSDESLAGPLARPLIQHVRIESNENRKLRYAKAPWMNSTIEPDANRSALIIDQ